MYQTVHPVAIFSGCLYTSTLKIATLTLFARNDSSSLVTSRQALRSGKFVLWVGFWYNINMKTNETVFNSPSEGKLDFDGVVQRIANFIKSHQDFIHHVVVGTDSKPANSKKGVDFITAVVVHRLNKGGIYFWRRVTVSKKFAIAERIGEETTLSLELASKLREVFRHNGLSGYEPEIHADVGENGATRDMIKWVTGMIIGSGFKAKIKPESYGASTIADKHT